MGKNILVGLFLITLLGATIVFFNSRPKTKHQLLDESSKQPIVNMTDFTAYRYQGHTLDSTVSADLATFFEPNVIEVYGHIRSKRHNIKDKHELAAESATAYLGAKGVTQFLKKSNIERAHVENDVRLGLDRTTLRTEYAEYSARDNTVKSDRPVTLIQPSGRMTGASGFELVLGENNLTIFGPLDGLIFGSGRQSGQE